MVDFSLNLCYGIVVPAEVIEDIQSNLTDEQYDKLIDNYARCINNWVGEDYFIGLSSLLSEDETEFVYPITSHFLNPFTEKDLADFKNFFETYNLWSFINWKPKLMLINFCF
jgi:hypothetical protein